MFCWFRSIGNLYEKFRWWIVKVSHQAGNERKLKLIFVENHAEDNRINHVFAEPSTEGISKQTYTLHDFKQKKCITYAYE